MLSQGFELLISLFSDRIIGVLESGILDKKLR
jgi:hypothetical protein